MIFTVFLLNILYIVYFYMFFVVETFEISSIEEKTLIGCKDLKANS